MHPNAILALTIFGLTVFVAVLVLAQSMSWRAAWQAWWQFTAYLLAMAAVGIVVGLGVMVFGP